MASLRSCSYLNLLPASRLGFAIILQKTTMLLSTIT